MKVIDHGHYRIYTDESAPDGWGVLCILVNDPSVGWAVVSHADYYVLRNDGTIYGMDYAGMIDAVVNDWANTQRVMIGRMIGREEFDSIFAHALRQRDLAQKSGFLPQEVRPNV